jgi:hypothetical protein
MITCLNRSGNKWKHMAKFVVHIFSKLVYKINMNNITKSIGKSFQILFFI